METCTARSLKCIAQPPCMKCRSGDIEAQGSLDPPLLLVGLRKPETSPVFLISNNKFEVSDTSLFCELLYFTFKKKV